MTQRLFQIIKFSPRAIHSCFVLHNYCEFNNFSVEPELVKIQIEKHRQDRLTIIIITTFILYKEIGFLKPYLQY